MSDNIFNSSSEPDILTGAMLVELNLKQFGLTRKLGIKATLSIADDHGNKVSFTGGVSPTTKASKWIIPKHLYDPIQKYQSETRRIHNDYTCGMRWTTNMDIMSTRMYSGGGHGMKPYAEFIEDRKFGLESLKHDFAHNIYPQAVITAKNDLGSLYHESDYPSNDEVYNLISMQVNVTPIAKGSDFRCSLDPKVQEDMAIEHDKRLLEVQKDSVMKLIAGLSEKVQHIHDSIENDRVLHDKTLADLYKHAINLPAIDFTSDDTLSDIASQVAMSLMDQGNLDKESLKDEAVRERTKQEADDLARKLDAYADVKQQEAT